MQSSGTYLGHGGQGGQQQDMQSNATYFAKGGGNDMESQGTYMQGGIQQNHKDPEDDGDSEMVKAMDNESDAIFPSASRTGFDDDFEQVPRNETIYKKGGSKMEEN